MTLTAPTLIFQAAAQAAEESWPFADEFLNMARQAARQQYGDFPAAMGPLEAHQTTAVTILLAAVETAEERDQPELADEVLRHGLTILARWSDHLAAQGKHPTLQAKT